MKKSISLSIAIVAVSALTIGMAPQASSATAKPAKPAVGATCAKTNAKAVAANQSDLICTKVGTKLIYQIFIPKGPIKIGFSAAVTGTNALLGQSYRGGVAFAVSQINAAGGIAGHTIDLVTADGGDTNPQWVNSMNVLAEEKPVMIIGHPHSSALLAQSDMINKIGVPYFFSGGSVALTQEKLKNPWIFRVSPSDGISGVAAIDYAVDELKYTKIGILGDNTAYGIDGTAVMVGELKKKGLTAVGTESHELFATDVSAQLLKLRAAGAQLIIGWSIPVVTATTLRQVQELKLGVDYMGGRSMALTAVLGLVTNAQLNGAFGAVDNAVAADPAAAAWVKAYKRYAGKNPDFFTAQYYDLVYMIKDWIAKNGVKPAVLRSAILKTGVTKGIGSDSYDFSRTPGESNWSAQIVKYSGDTVAVLKTISIAP